MRVTKNGDLVQSFLTTARSRQTLKGKVADDAKLDTRAPKPTPQVRVTSFSFRGQSRAQADASVERAARAYAGSFPDLMKEERDNARRREAIWQEAGKCADLRFEPASGTLTLAKDAAGQVTARVEAKAGGTASRGRWTVSAQQNARFNPDSAEGGSAPFSYTVTRAGRGVEVSAKFRATSTAGVAEGTWTQPTNEREPAVIWIHGEFDGSSDAQGAKYDWNGSVRYVRTQVPPYGATGSYPLQSAAVTVHASGSYGAFGALCTMSGSKQLAQGLGGSITVFGSPPLGESPYSYGASVSLTGSDVLMTVTLGGCADPDLNNTTAMVPMPVELLGTGPSELSISADGLAYAGTRTTGGPGAGSTETWSLHGETTPPPPPAP